MVPMAPSRTRMCWPSASRSRLMPDIVAARCASTRRCRCPKIETPVSEKRDIDNGVLRLQRKDITTLEVRAMQMGLREANQHFSKAIRAVKAGKEVVLTERGRPIAVISPLNASGEEAALRRMEAVGLLRRATRRGPMPPVRRMRIRGKPLSVTIREDRDAR